MQDFHILSAIVTTALVTVIIMLAGLSIYEAYRLKNYKYKTQATDILNVFLDLETLGTNREAPVLVIAAYIVDNHGNRVTRYSANVDVEDAKKHGIVDHATVAWWNEQSGAARFQAFEATPRVLLFNALNGLASTINDYKKGYAELRVWGNSPSFDCEILRHAYGACSLETPWYFRQEACVRTMSKYSDAKDSLEFSGEPHVALHDARHQARYTMETLKRLGAL